MRALSFLLILIALTVSGAPQTSKAPRRSKPKPPPPAKAGELAAWPIASLAVTGNENYTDAQILKVVGLAVGQMASKTDFDAARDRLLATGAFGTVGYRFEPSVADPRKYAATFEVIEIPQVYDFRVEELPIDKKTAAEWLASKETLFSTRIPATQDFLARYAKHLEELLTKQGRPMRVTARLVPEVKDNLVVVFLPASLPAVAEVQFLGSKAFDNNALQRAVTGAAIGALYTERRFRQILETSLRPMYEAKGLVRVSFPKLETAPTKNVDGIAVKVTVEEGGEYKLGGVRVNGAGKDIQDVVKFRVGETVNFAEIDEKVGEMVKALRKKGYLKAAARTEREIEDKAREVAVDVTLEPGPQYTMGTLTITGLDIQTEPHIRKLWAPQGGKPFNGEYPEYFLKRIHEDGIFENLGETKADVKLDDTKLTADVTLQFGRGTDLPQAGPDAVEKRKPNY